MPEFQCSLSLSGHSETLCLHVYLLITHTPYFSFSLFVIFSLFQSAYYLFYYVKRTFDVLLLPLSSYFSFLQALFSSLFIFLIHSLLFSVSSLSHFLIMSLCLIFPSITLANTFCLVTPLSLPLSLSISPLSPLPLSIFSHSLSPIRFVSVFLSLFSLSFSPYYVSALSPPLSSSSPSSFCCCSSSFTLSKLQVTTPVYSF